ncbi:MAG: heme NO-binding domain-containing protein [Akkermansiaceae bacterium]|nr:heme NO-binding domain-containing protein [Akkermansiaceae bacterium]NNM28360.1 heme NO-binding domain-containing protein [Akkermansiaceae bacterium]
MKGIVFTEFLGMVETAHGLDMVDTLIEKSDLPSGGAYTAVGTYDHTEIVRLVTNLSAETNTPVPDLLKAFGEHLFGVLAAAHPHFVEGAGDALEFLERVENYIHVEVRKLYPDAELPRFECARPGPGQLEMIYDSMRHFEDLCEGLIAGCLKHFGARAGIARETLADGREKFVITRQDV